MKYKRNTFTQLLAAKFKNLIYMKRVILLIQFSLFYSLAFSQCVEFDFLSHLFGKSFETQDQLLEGKGFTINENYGKDFGMDWVNNNTDEYILIRRNDVNKVDNVQYRLKGHSKCYKAIKSELSTLGFKKDYETIGKYSIFYFFYKSDNLGVVLSKWKAPDGYVGNFYQINIYNLSSYYSELEKRK